MASKVKGIRYQPSALRHKKAQFFIASAVIIILAVYFIYFNVIKTNEPDYASVEVADFTYLIQNIQDEYNNIVEVTLSNVSRTSGANANDALDANLTYFDGFVANLTAERHISANIASARVRGNATHMNATVNITLKGVNSQITSRFFAVRDIQVAITQIVTCTAGPNVLNFRARVLKEYDEPVVGLVLGDFNIEYDGSDITPSFTEEGAGIYLFESSTACSTGDPLKVNSTGKRMIAGTTTISMP